jgi:DNA-directed RNA polymerase subunit RPC12/RpoP
MPEPVTKRCAVCGRFRAYQSDDAHCIVCGQEALESSCACGREFDYALAETGPIHCPRCGKAFHGKSSEFDG